MLTHKINIQDTKLVNANLLKKIFETPTQLEQFELIRVELENKILPEIEHTYIFLEEKFTMDKIFIKIKEQIVLCKAYINELTNVIEVYEYYKDESYLSDRKKLFLEPLLRHTIDLTKIMVNEPNLNLSIKEIEFILDEIYNANDVKVLKILLEQKLLSELRYIERLFNLYLIHKEEDLLSERYVDDNQALKKFPLSETQIDTKNIIIEKIKNGEYKEEYIKCNCGADDYIVIGKKDRFGLPLRVVLCKSCSLLYVNPRMNQESYDDFYNNYYRILYNYRNTYGDLSDEDKKSFIESQINTGINIKDFLCEEIKDKKLNVLEIGCGAGGILKPFQDDGHTCLGIDLGSEYIRYGREAGLNLLQCHSSELLVEYTNSFDVIILSDVIEHILDLDKEIDIIRKLLKPDGILYIGTPGTKNIFRYGYDFLRSFQNAHTYYFSLNTLTNVMNRNNFEIVKGNEQIKAIYRINEHTYKNYSREFDYIETLEYMKIIEQYFRKIFIFN